MSLKVTSIQFCAMRYVSCNSCCCAVQPVTFTKEVAFLVLASVVEFRSTISEIDKSHDSFSHSAPHGVWDGDGASTNRTWFPAGGWRSRHGDATNRLRTPAIIDSMLCPQPYSSTRRRVMRFPCFVVSFCNNVVLVKTMVVHREGQSQCIDGAASEETCHIREKEGTEVTLEENAFFSWYPDPPISEHRNDSTYATNNATSQHTTCSPRTESCLVKNPLAKAILSGKRDTRKSHAHKVLRTIVILELVSLERLHSNTSPVHLLLS